jgi:hypothetical protein
MLDEIKRRGVEIIETNADTFPEEYDEAAFADLSDKAWEHVVALATMARRYWSGYIIKDHFEKDDDKRSAFQTEMGNKFKCYELFQAKNKLRIATQQGVHGMFRNVVADLNRAGITTPEANKIRAMYASLFPVATVGVGSPELFIRDAETLDQIKNVGERFPSFPDIRDSRGYRPYFLDLTEGQRLKIVASFDTAAHEFLAMARKRRIHSILFAPSNLPM